MWTPLSPISPPFSLGGPSPQFERSSDRAIDWAFNWAISVVVSTNLNDQYNFQPQRWICNLEENQQLSSYDRPTVLSVFLLIWSFDVFQYSIWLSDDLDRLHGMSGVGLLEGSWTRFKQIGTSNKLVPTQRSKWECAVADVSTSKSASASTDF